MQKHTLEEMQKIALSHGGECLSSSYTNNKVELEWKCSAGHIWSTRPDTILRGHWCKKCGMRRAGMKNRFTLAELKAIAQERGGKLLSKGYREGKIKLRWLCAENHEFKMTSIMVSSGQWCPECSTGKSERMCRLYFEVMFGRKFPKSKPSWLIGPKGYKLELDGYCEELKLAFEYQGVQHYFLNRKFNKSRSLEQQKGYDNMKRDLCAQQGVVLVEIPCTVKYNWLKPFILRRCKVNNIPVPHPEVTINPQEVYSPKKLSEIKKIAESKGGSCLSERCIDNSTKLRFRCRNGHEWETIPKVIKRENWCRVCSGNAKSNISEMQKLAVRKGGKCLSCEYVGTLSKLEWECAKEHKWKATPISI